MHRLRAHERGPCVRVEAHLRVREGRACLYGWDVLPLMPMVKAQCSWPEQPAFTHSAYRCLLNLITPSPDACHIVLQIEVIDPELYRYDSECLTKAADLGKPGVVSIQQRQDTFIFKVCTCMPVCCKRLG